jgi:hypothetical protein
MTTRYPEPAVRLRANCGPKNTGHEQKPQRGKRQQDRREKLVAPRDLPDRVSRRVVHARSNHAQGACADKYFLRRLDFPLVSGARLTASPININAKWVRVYGQFSTDLLHLI